MSAVPILEARENVANVLVVNEDITERRKAEDALRTSEARYRSLVEQLPLTIYSAALGETHANYVSPQVAKMTGYPAEMFLRDCVDPGRNGARPRCRG